MTHPRPLIDGTFTHPNPLIPSLWAAASVMLLLAPATTFGQATLEETVVIASRVPTPLSEVGVSVDVLDRELISLLGYRDLSSLLDIQTGISVTRDGGYGKAAAIRMRGEEGYRTRVLLDGIDLSDPSSPQISPRIEHLLTEGIERIEILRGPQGLMYGADAGGVIALTSRQTSEGINADIFVEAGEENFQQLGVNVSAGNDWVQGSVSWVDMSTDGFNARPSDVTPGDNDGYENQTLHGNLNVIISDQWNLQMSSHIIDADNDYDVCYSAVDFSQSNLCTDTFEQSSYRVALNWRTETLTSSLSVEELSSERIFATEGVSTFKPNSDQREISWLSTYQSPIGRLILGVDLQEQSYDDEYSQRERDNTGIYGELQLPAFLGKATAGVRYDDNDDFGQHTSWRLSTSQPLPFGPESLVLRAAIGTGFRAPSLYEVGYNQGPFSYPPASLNPLREEQSKGWEIGLHWEQGPNALSVTWFDQHIENEIVFDLATYSGYLQNDDRVASKGIELAGEVAIGRSWSILANGTWNDTETSNGSQRAYRPELSTALSLLWSRDRYQSALTLRGQFDSVDVANVPMPDTHQVDWRITAEIAGNFMLSFRVENMTNQTQQRIRDYATQGRASYLGLRYSL